MVFVCRVNILRVHFYDWATNSEPYGKPKHCNILFTPVQIVKFYLKRFMHPYSVVPDSCELRHLKSRHASQLRYHVYCFGSAARESVIISAFQINPLRSKDIPLRILSSVVVMYLCVCTFSPQNTIFNPKKNEKNHYTFVQ